MNEALMNAILSMDGYSRGYDEAIRIDSTLNPINGSTKVGNATVFLSNGGAEAQDSGFYSIAYSYGSKTIISYRGTDRNIAANEIASDAWNGYGRRVGGAHFL